MSRASRLPLRVRLVAGFSAAMLLVLAAAGGFVYWRVEYALDRGLDSDLSQADDTLTPLVGTDGRVGASDRGTARATGVVWQVVASDGTVLDHGGAAPPTPLVSRSRLPLDGGSQVQEVGSLLPTATPPYRLHLESLARPPQATLLVGVRRDRRDEALRELLLQLGLAGLGALVITAFVGERLARAALRPVEAYRRRAEEVAAGDVGLRLDVPPERDDEVTRLGHTLNEMLAAQEVALERERRFVQEASHELRTPLTLLRSRIQLTRRRERARPELESALDELLVDVDRLAGLADHLLELSTLDAQVPHVSDPGPTHSVDPVAVVQDVLGRLTAGEPGPSQRYDVRLDVAHEEVRVPLPARDLERLISNLLDNAVTHGAPPVSLRMRREDDRLVVEVGDRGPGMGAELLEVATHRFVRSDEARSRPGAGLGLALVASIVGSVGGELRICSGGLHVSAAARLPVPCRHPDQMTFTVILPTR